MPSTHALTDSAEPSAAAAGPFVEDIPSTGARQAEDDQAVAESFAPHADPLPASAAHVAGMLFAVLAPLLGLGVAVWWASTTGRFSWFDVALTLGGAWLTGAGITLGYHRMLTHRAFEASPVTRAALTALGALSLQKSPLDWCAAHRRHHATSDAPGDPHSPHIHDGPDDKDRHFLHTVRGLWHAHTGWLFGGHIMVTDHKRYVPDLLQDRFAVWVHRSWIPLWVPLTFAIPAAVGAVWYGTFDGRWSEGAWRGLLWGGLARVFLLHHATWSVNSVCHLWGRRDFDCRDESRNNWLLAPFTAGEAWHNNHHAFPTSARLGLRWWQLDTGWMMLRMLEFCGLVKEVRVPTAESIERRRFTP